MKKHYDPNTSHQLNYKAGEGQLVLVSTTMKYGKRAQIAKHEMTFLELNHQNDVLSSPLLLP